MRRCRNGGRPQRSELPFGDVDDLRAGLDASEAVRIYRQYVDAYGLGYDVSSRDQIDMPAFQGSVSLPYSSER